MKAFTLFCTAALAALVPPAKRAAAFSQADLEKLLRTNACVGCDLSNADLKGVSLVRSDSSHKDGGWTGRLQELFAFITGANAETGLCGLDPHLAGAKLTSANLRGAILCGADLRKADLSGAELTGADLEGANLNGANLHDAILTDADLSWACLESADLTFCYLSGANLNYANLTGSDLTGANLSYTNLRGAVLTDAKTSKTNLSNAFIGDPVLRKSIKQQNTDTPDK